MHGDFLHLKEIILKKLSDTERVDGLTQKLPDQDNPRAVNGRS
jgi:hypothetical protein